MYAFGYKRPQSVKDAADLLEADVEPRLLAGGQTLLAAMKHRLTAHSNLIDLQEVAELKGISKKENTISIASMTCHADVAASETVRTFIPALAGLAGGIGDPSVRNMGTIGGSVANNDPAADYPGGVLGLGASIETDRRVIHADDFFTGMFSTALEPGEIICRFNFPIPRRAGYFKFADTASGYVRVGAFVAEFEDGVRVAINGAGETAFRLSSLEEALQDNFAHLEIEDYLPDASDLIDDPRAPAEYKRNLIKPVLVKAIDRALDQKPIQLIQ